MGRGVAEMKINARGSPWADFDGADLVYWRGRSEIEIGPVVPPAYQSDPVTPLVIWTVYKTRETILANTWRGSSSSRKMFIGPENSISSRSLRDVRNLLQSLYPGLIQLKRPPDDEPHV